jgi:hypothetical protein
VRSILGQELLDDATAMRRAALTLAGGINYVHPYQDGNGRTGRVMHYLLEFGVERGDQAFNNELYAIIAKIPTYDDHYANALDDTPPAELTQALDELVADQDPNGSAELDDRAAASRRVVVFLDMMQVGVVVPIDQDIVRAYHVPTSRDPAKITNEPAGTLDGLTLYEREYLNKSSLPHYEPHDQSDVGRVIARRKSPGGRPLVIDIDVLPEL